MTENKRFVEFLTQNVDDGNLNSGFYDITYGNWYYTRDTQNAKSICELLNKIAEENKELQKENEELEDELELLEGKLWNCKHYR